MKRYIFIGLLLGLLEALTGFSSFDLFNKSQDYTQASYAKNGDEDKDKDKDKDKDDKDEHTTDLNDGAEDDNQHITFRPGFQN